MIETRGRSLLIAGPCAAESREQVVSSATMAKEREITHLRASLWKPRTKPGFDGVGLGGIQWLQEVAQMGMTPATEVLTKEHAESVVDAISGKLNSDVLIWVGSRNQNHITQQDIGRVVQGDSHSQLLVKNQPWMDERHWLGIVDHVIHGGADPKQIILCHRGFAPGGDGMRNRPDFAMAMRVKKATGLRMMIDPSHIGGSIDAVKRVAHDAQEFEENGLRFDGLMIEVHPNPDLAKTDADQQLSWEEFDQMSSGVIFQR